MYALAYLNSEIEYENYKQQSWLEDEDSITRDYLTGWDNNKLQPMQPLLSSINEDEDLITRDYLTGWDNTILQPISFQRVVPVSTDLVLFSDPWKIRKKLTESDVNGSSRLLIPSSLVMEHILPFLSFGDILKIENSENVSVNVWDDDTDSEHRVKFKKWSSSQAFVLTGQWTEEFVRRRRLKKNDEICLRWNYLKSRLEFHVSS